MSSELIQCILESHNQLIDRTNPFKWIEQKLKRTDQSDLKEKNRCSCDKTIVFDKLQTIRKKCNNW